MGASLDKKNRFTITKKKRIVGSAKRQTRRAMKRKGGRFLRREGKVGGGMLERLGKKEGIDKKKLVKQASGTENIEATRWDDVNATYTEEKLFRVGGERSMRLQGGGVEII